jgi:hypothetical protein
MSCGRWRDKRQGSPDIVSHWGIEQSFEIRIAQLNVVGFLQVVTNYNPRKEKAVVTMNSSWACWKIFFCFVSGPCR